MGTQFKSRLKSASYRKQILEGIKAARVSVSPDGEKVKAAAPKIESLSRAQVRKIGTATIGEVITIAGSRGFFLQFEQSALFEDILSWLKRLWKDANYDGFQGIIKEYSLDKSINPVAELTRRLSALTEAKKGDPFRIVASNAARSVLAEAATRTVQANHNDSPAQKFGRKLQTFDLRDLVARFIYNFVRDFIYGVISMADPDQTNKMVQEALDLSEPEINRISKLATERVKKEGKLCDVKRTREIVHESLQTFDKA